VNSIAAIFFGASINCVLLFYSVLGGALKNGFFRSNFFHFFAKSFDAVFYEGMICLLSADKKFEMTNNVTGKKKERLR
jgi:hypothetical protein